MASSTAQTKTGYNYWNADAASEESAAARVSARREAIKSGQIALPNPNPIARLHLSLRERVAMIMIVLIAGIVFFGVIFATGYAAEIQNDINRTNSQIAAVQEDIDNLNVEIERGNNVATIETKAMEMQMYYPGEDQLVYTENLASPGPGLAQRIREKAYEDW